MRYLREQVFVYAEGVSFFLSLGISFLGLIQSQRQTGAASAAGSEKYANATGHVAVEIGVQFLFRGVCYSNHVYGLPEIVYYSGKGGQHVCQSNSSG